MDIIIVGAGTVGCAICKQLLPEGHNVTVIDTDVSPLSELSSSSDDLSILRGILAEKENLPPEQIRVVIEPLDTSSIGDFSDEIESNIGSDVTLF